MGRHSQRERERDWKSSWFSSRMKINITYYRPVLKTGNMGHRCKVVALGLQRHIMHHSDG